MNGARSTPELQLDAGRSSNELVELLAEGIDVLTDLEAAPSPSLPANHLYFIGEVSYLQEGQEAPRKVSFDPRASFERSLSNGDLRKRTMSDYGWYDFDVDGRPVSPADVTRSASSSHELSDHAAQLDNMLPVGILTNWHSEEERQRRSNGGRNRPKCAKSGLTFNRGGADYTVVAVIKVLNFLISTRSFGTVRPASSADAAPPPRGLPLQAVGKCFAWAVPEIRIVARGGSGAKHAEFLVAAAFGSEVWSAWKRSSDFEKLAEVLRSRKLEEDGKSFEKAVTVWEAMQKQRRWFRCLEPKYLRLKSYYIESFLQELLFQVDEHEDLITFFEPEFRGAAYEDSTADTGGALAGDEATKMPTSGSSSSSSLPKTSPASTASLNGDWPSSTAL